MGLAPFAFSVHSFISSVGADAGFASIVGLAVLVLLYFAQARETDSLREQTHESARRVQQLEGRLAYLSGLQESSSAPAAPRAAVPPASSVSPAAPAASAPASAASPAGSAASPAGPAAAPVRPAASTAAAQAASRPVEPANNPPPAPPAGVGAPALAAATRLIPDASPRSAMIPDAPPPSASPQTAQEPQSSSAQDREAIATPPPPATPAAGNGAAQEGGAASLPVEEDGAASLPAQEAAAAPLATQEGASALVSGVHHSPVQAPPRFEPPPQPSGARPILQPLRPASRDRQTRRRLALAVGALVAVGVIAVLVIVTSVGGGGHAGSGASSNSNAPTARHPRHVAAAAPPSVSVAVLNGTAASGLAHRVATRLQSAGYKQGTIATASDQTRGATVVAFMPGHRRDALSVAGALKLGSASVQPVDASTQAVACPPPATCGAAVVVTVGSDLSTR